MVTNMDISLSKQETSLVDVLWNLYTLQTINVKKAFRWKIENDTLADTEPDEKITETAHYREAMDDVKEGRVTRYNSLKDFYKEMGV